MRALSAGVTGLFGNCVGGKYPVYSSCNNAERRTHDYEYHCAWGQQVNKPLRCDEATINPMDGQSRTRLLQ